MSLAEAKKRVVRFSELRPLQHLCGKIQLTAQQRVLYQYLGNQASEATGAPPAVEGISMNVSLPTAEPGRGGRPCTTTSARRS